MLPDNEGRRTRERKRGNRSDFEICAQKIARPPSLGTGTMDSPDRDFPRRGNELTSCQTSLSRKSPGTVECRWHDDASSIGFPVSSFPEQDMSPSSASCDEDWQLRRSGSVWYWKLEITFQITIGRISRVSWNKAARAKRFWPARLSPSFLLSQLYGRTP